MAAPIPGETPRVLRHHGGLMTTTALPRRTSENTSMYGRCVQWTYPNDVTVSWLFSRRGTVVEVWAFTPANGLTIYPIPVRDAIEAYEVTNILLASATTHLEVTNHDD